MGVELVCFQETNMEVITKAIAKSVLGGRWVKYKSLLAIHFQLSKSFKDQTRKRKKLESRNALIAKISINQ